MKLKWKFPYKSRKKILGKKSWEKNPGKKILKNDEIDSFEMTPLTTAPDIHFFITVAEKEPRILSSAPRIRQRIRQRILKSALNLRRKTPPLFPRRIPKNAS